MSVLIKGMDELPEDGAVLVVRHYDDGTIYIKYAGTYGYSMRLVKLPDTHGRLGDLDALIIDLMDRGLEGIQTDDWAEIQQTVMEQPTIVEAEGET